MIHRSFSHYRIVEKIGQGGMGEVFLAEDTSLERKVAIKFLPEAMVSDRVARERFLREAKSAATLDHPHICVVHEASEVEGAPFIVMEYVEGESLRETMARGPLPLEETVRLAAEIAEALEEAHSRHIVHRDLKPANVMLTRTGHVKVMDFGLAKRLASSERRAPEEETLTELTQMGTTVGTLAYMSPEQLQGQEVDHRSDIFAFGALLYEMLAGVHPFRKEVGMVTAAAILSTEPAPLAQHATEIPQQLVKLVSEMLAKEPARRIQSMRAVHEQLKQILLEVQPRPEEAGVLNLRKLGRSLRRPRVVIPAASTWNGNIFSPGIVVPYNLERVLNKKGSLPPGMARVEQTETPVGMLADFYIDRYEVTNKQYKEFVRAGGYQHKEFWKERFFKDGKELSWEDAVRTFVDQTGRPGPAGWQAGDHPEGEAEYPVSGISWYEAAAYAAYAGKSLPTGFHWGVARGEYTPTVLFPQLGGFAILARFANFWEKRPVPVGSLPGMTAYGAFDMAGNVREWCSNETAQGRLIRGGAWEDNTYMFDAWSQAAAGGQSDQLCHTGKAAGADVERPVRFVPARRDLIETYV
jgi:serine/threonine protein kinase